MKHTVKKIDYFYSILAFIISFPLLSIFSEGESLWPNIFGFAYGYGLYKFSFTKIGKQIVESYLRVLAKFEVWMSNLK